MDGLVAANEDDENDDEEFSWFGAIYKTVALEPPGSPLIERQSLSMFCLAVLKVLLLPLDSELVRQASQSSPSSPLAGVTMSIVELPNEGMGFRGRPRSLFDESVPVLRGMPNIEEGAGAAYVE
ncbi:hypothetical protein MPER_09936 [Moniliophthora perniciosa FA553]|nr:hypothetical protein MPER_09936 [Moniliophthora perniciosa FA553]